MIKSIITPNSDKYEVEIPQKYIGKKVEIRMSLVDDSEEPYQDRTKEDILDGLQEAVEEANLIRKGELKPLTKEELFNGL